MDTASAIIKKYERYVAALKAADEEKEKVIGFQEEMIEGLQELLVQKDEEIAILVAELEKGMATAKEMAQMMDTFFQD